MHELKKMERYLRVNWLGPGPRFIKKEFTGPRSHKGWETLFYTIGVIFIIYYYRYFVNPSNQICFLCWKCYTIFVTIVSIQINHKYWYSTLHYTQLIWSVPVAQTLNITLLQLLFVIWTHVNVLNSFNKFLNCV